MSIICNFVCVFSSDRSSYSDSVLVEIRGNQLFEICFPLFLLLLLFLLLSERTSGVSQVIFFMGDDN